MKICKRGLEYVQIRKNGDVVNCSWATRKIGNLLCNDMDEIYHGKEMEEFRESLLDGSYRYCTKEKCPWLSNDTMDEHMVEADSLSRYPKQVSLSYEPDCNYICTSCRSQRYIKSEKEKNNLEKLEEQIMKFINEVQEISANGIGELFAGKSILKILANWKPSLPTEDVKVVLESNGSMFDSEHWKQIANLGQYELDVHITVHSFEELVYQFLSGTSISVQKVCDNLNFIKKLRAEGVVNFFEIATVVQEANFRELPRFTERCIYDYNADSVRIRSYFPYGCRTKEFEWFCDVRNPKHPFYKEYLDVMKHPIFNNERVYMWSGNEKSGIGAHPFEKGYKKYRGYYEMICAMTLNSCKDEFREKCKEKIEHKNVAIYGVGNVGKVLAQNMMSQDIPVECFFDKYSKDTDYLGIPVYSICEKRDLSGIDIIIISVSDDYDLICDSLRTGGYCGEIVLLAELIKS